MEKVKKQAGSPRIYEYIDGDGHTYWSFRKPTRTVGSPVRLYNNNRRGQILGTFLQELRQDGILLWEIEQETEDIG